MSVLRLSHWCSYYNHTLWATQRHLELLYEYRGSCSNTMLPHAGQISMSTVRAMLLYCCMLFEDQIFFLMSCCLRQEHDENQAVRPQSIQSFARGVFSRYSCLLHSVCYQPLQNLLLSTLYYQSHHGRSNGQVLECASCLKVDLQYAISKE